jgi:hypothetical protein
MIIIIKKTKIRKPALKNKKLKKLSSLRGKSCFVNRLILNRLHVTLIYPILQ